MIFGRPTASHAPRASALRLGACVLAGALAITASPFPVAARGPSRVKKRRGATDLDQIVEVLRESERAIVDAERAAGVVTEPTPEQLAKKLVDGEYKLALGDAEAAAILFLDLIEHHGDTPAGIQAVYDLGRALTQLGMLRWAAEVFSRNLADDRPRARMFHQQSVAALFDLRYLRREAGFARVPGLSATPEGRARLASLGLPTTRRRPPKGPVGDADAERLERWAQTFAPENRVPELAYAYGRFLYFSERYAEAVEELDRVGRPDVPTALAEFVDSGERLRLQAAYFAAAALLADGRIEEAKKRFARVAQARATSKEGQRIAELGWLAVARIHHDEGDYGEAEAAYRNIGRDSPFFSEALYELAWTYLRGGRFDEAERALDLLLLHDPNSPVAAEIRQLRGKVKIQRKDYPAAEKEFLAMRRAFDRLAGGLEGRLAQTDEATIYFGAVLGDDMAHFTLDRVLPVAALPVANGIRRLTHAEDLARAAGTLREELRETRDMLARMEEAVRARERARLFTDLGAHLSAVDTAERDVVGVLANLLARVATRAGRNATTWASRARTWVDTIDRPPGSKGRTRAEVLARLQAMGRRVHRLRQQIQAYRAQAVAAERYYETTRRDQKIDHEGFLRQAADVRSRIVALEQRAQALEAELVRAETRLRYDDPLYDVRARAKAGFVAFVDQAFAALGEAADPETKTLWRRARALLAAADEARGALDRAAGVRLTYAMRVLAEERANLDAYLVEFEALEAKATDLVSTVLAAGYRDVVRELRTLVLRSEVGLLDVAWAMKEVEQKAVERLEQEQTRNLQELDRLLEAGLEELGR